MKLREKSENGVTIIELIVTIIVMLILTGVSVKIATGDSTTKGVVQLTTREREKQRNVVTNEEQSINKVVEEQNTTDWGY